MSRKPFLGVKKLNELAKLPDYAKQGDSGFDVSSVEEVIIEPFTNKLISIGLAFEIPNRHEVQLRPRSGLSAKGLVAAFGTVDEGYKGEVKVNLFNHTKEPFIVNIGDRIAQGVLAPVTQANIIEVNQLSSSERGADGFGSTGV